MTKAVWFPCGEAGLRRARFSYISQHINKKIFIHIRIVISALNSTLEIRSNSPSVCVCVQVGTYVCCLCVCFAFQCMTCLRQTSVLDKPCTKPHFYQINKETILKLKCYSMILLRCLLFCLSSIANVRESRGIKYALTDKSSSRCVPKLPTDTHQPTHTHPLSAVQYLKGHKVP